MYYLILPTPAARDRLAAHLRQRGIASAPHYPPLHLSTMGRRFGGNDGDCPVAESVSGRLLRLPFYTLLPEAHQQRVIAAVTAFNA